MSAPRPLLVVVCLLSVASAGCDKLAKSTAMAAAKSASHGSAEQSKTRPDPVHEYAREQQKAQSMRVYFESVLEELQAISEKMTDDPAGALERADAVLKKDADRDAEYRMTEERRALVLLVRGDLRGLCGKAEAAKSDYEAIVASAAGFEGEVKALVLPQSLYRIGRFGEAFEAKQASLAFVEEEDRAQAREDLAELAFLARRSEASELLAEAGKTDHPEKKAVLATYRAIVEASQGRRKKALAALDEALKVGTSVTGRVWSFATLVPPFPGDAPWERCAGTFYEAVRELPESTPFTPVHEATKALRACVARLPAKD